MTMAYVLYAAVRHQKARMNVLEESGKGIISPQLNLSHKPMCCKSSSYHHSFISADKLRCFEMYARKDEAVGGLSTACVSHRVSE